MKKKKAQKTRAKPKQRVTTKTAAPQTKGYIFKAIPSNFQVRATMASSSEPQFVFPGRLVFTKQINEGVEQQAKTLWHSTEQEGEEVAADWIVNKLADADHYPHALGFLDEAYASQGVPVFNPPDAVMKTRRHSAAHFLSGIENLIIPQCQRFTPKHPNHFLQAFEQCNFSFPVLIRPTGSHTGTDLVLIENSEDWHKIFQLPWGGQEVYMTQWTDFQSADGEWRKLRLSITPHSVRLRHILYGDNWLIHSSERGVEEVERELEAHYNLDELEILQKLGNNIRDRFGMDFFGVDLGWKSDAEFILFEANASMSILAQTKMPEHRRDEYLSIFYRIESDVEEALSNFVKGVEERGT